MSRYLDPKADVVFKRIFGDHPHLLISFLNAVLPLPTHSPIIELEYLTAEQVPHIPTFKHTIADVKCKDSQGRVFIVEMQINWTDSFKQRLLFGTGQALVKQLAKGEDYDLIQPVYGLGIISAIYEKETPRWYHHYQLVRVDDPVHDVIEHLQLIFIELPKFPVRSEDEKQLRLLWLRFLREINEQTVNVSQDLLAIPEISEAVELSEQLAYSPGELLAYEAYWDAVSIERTIKSGGFKEGKKEGREEGKERGKNEGIAEVAKKMLKQGIDISVIKSVTGLSKEEIDEPLISSVLQF